MRILIQRSLEASVAIAGKTVGAIDHGMVVFVGFTHTDTEKEIDYMIDKIINLRIYEDEDGVMNKSILDTNGSVLSISQFTLYANPTKGRRPSYIDAMPGALSSPLYDLFNKKLSEHIHVEKGIFGADMKVSLVNDGPTTIWLEK